MSSILYMTPPSEYVTGRKFLAAVSSNESIDRKERKRVGCDPFCRRCDPHFPESLGYDERLAQRLGGCDGPMDAFCRRVAGVSALSCPDQTMFDGCPVLLVLLVQITQGGQVARGFWLLVVGMCGDNALGRTPSNTLPFLKAGILQCCPSFPFLFSHGWLFN